MKVLLVVKSKMMENLGPGDDLSGNVKEIKKRINGKE